MENNSKVEMTACEAGGALGSGSGMGIDTAMGAMVLCTLGLGTRGKENHGLDTRGRCKEEIQWTKGRRSMLCTIKAFRAALKKSLDKVSQWPHKTTLGWSKVDVKVTEGRPSCKVAFSVGGVSEGSEGSPSIQSSTI